MRILEFINTYMKKFAIKYLNMVSNKIIPRTITEKKLYKLLVTVESGKHLFLVGFCYAMYTEKVL